MLLDEGEGIGGRAVVDLFSFRGDDAQRPVVEVRGEVPVHDAHVVGGEVELLGQKVALEGRVGEDLLVEELHEIVG